MYKIVRYYMRGSKRAVGLYFNTEEEAQTYLKENKLETSSTTATGYRARKRTRERGPWFEGYTRCKR